MAQPYSRDWQMRTLPRLKMIYLVNEDSLFVETNSRETYVANNVKTIDAIASFTTCRVRLKLNFMT